MKRETHTFFFATIDGRGSVFNFYHAIASELVSRGHRAVLLVEGHRFDAEDRDGEPAVLVWPSPRPTRWKDALFLGRLIRNYGPVCISSCFSAVTICTLVGWLHRVPVRATWARTLDRQIRLDVPMHPLKRFLLNRRRRIVYRLATRILSNSEATMHDLEESFGVPPSRVDVVPVRLPDPGFDAGASRLGTVLFAGRLSPSKGIDTLLRALVRVLEKHPDLKAEFIGEGPMRGRYEAMAAELGLEGACVFHGAIPKHELDSRMASAAMLVSPSRCEAFGLVNLEAMRVGTPVVATRTGGIPEVVADGETGLLVPPDEPGPLAEAIVRLLDDEDLRNRLGKAGRERFVKVFGMHRIGEHADYFERLAGIRQDRSPEH